MNSTFISEADQIGLFRISDFKNAEGSKIFGSGYITYFLDPQNTVNNRHQRPSSSITLQNLQKRNEYLNSAASFLIRFLQLLLLCFVHTLFIYLYIPSQFPTFQIIFVRHRPDVKLIPQMCLIILLTYTFSKKYLKFDTTRY